MKKILLALAAISTITTASDTYSCALQHYSALGADIIKKDLNELDYLDESMSIIGNTIHVASYTGNFDEELTILKLKYLVYAAGAQGEKLIYWCKERGELTVTYKDVLSTKYICKKQ